MKFRGAPFHKVNIFLLFNAVLYAFDPLESENRHIFLIRGRRFEVYFCSRAPGRHLVVTGPFFLKPQGPN